MQKLTNDTENIKKEFLDNEINLNKNIDKATFIESETTSNGDVEDIPKEIHIEDNIDENKVIENINTQQNLIKLESISTHSTISEPINFISQTIIIL